MENYIQAEDYELWMVIVNGLYMPVKVTTDGKIVPKEPKEFDSDDFRKMEKMPKPRSCCILDSDLTSTLASQSVNPQKRYGMPFK